MALLGPFAELDQMPLQPLDRIAERPVLLIVLGAIARRIVAGGMRGGAVGHQFDQASGRRRCARARAAHCVTAYTARKSLPSTRMPAMP